MWGRRGGVNLLDTDEMAAFFERLDHLNEGELLGLRAAWRSTSRGAHEEAWAAVRAVGVREGLSKEIDRVRNRALGWASRGSNSNSLSDQQRRDLATDQDRSRRGHRRRSAGAGSRPPPRREHAQNPDRSLVARHPGCGVGAAASGPHRADVRLSRTGLGSSVARHPGCGVGAAASGPHRADVRLSRTGFGLFADRRPIDARSDQEFGV